DRVDLRLGAHPRSRRLGGSRGSVVLRLVVQLDDLGSRKRTRRFLGEAHHQGCPPREVGGVEARHAHFSRPPVHGLDAEAGRTEDQGNPERQAPLDVREDSVRPGEVDGRVAVVRNSLDLVPNLVTRRREGGHEHRTDLPAGPEEGDVHQAAFESSAGLMRATASRKRLSSGPIPAAERRLGVKSAAASSATSSAVTASTRLTTSSIERSGVSVTVAFPSRVMRLEVDSRESRSLPFRFSLARSSSSARTFPAERSSSSPTAISRQSATLSSRVPTYKPT